MRDREPDLVDLFARQERRDTFRRVWDTQAAQAEVQFQTYIHKREIKFKPLYPILGEKH